MNNGVDITSMGVRSELGYTQRPIRQRRAVTDTYLDGVTIAGVAKITGGSVGTPLNPQLIPLLDNNYDALIAAGFSSSELNLNGYNKIVAGKLPRKVTSDGGIEIPADGTYMVIWEWQRYVGKNPGGDADAIANFGTNKTLIPIAAFSNKQGEALSLFYQTAKPFYITVDVMTASVTTSMPKGAVLYIIADHRRAGITFPVIGGIYITKLS